MKTIRCIVACENALGAPDLFFVKVRATDEQYSNGEHYDVAAATAEVEGYASRIVYDEFDSAGKAMLKLFKWKTASVVDCA